MKLLSDELIHSYKDSKWGYSNGKPNGKRKAGEGKIGGVNILSPSNADYTFTERIEELPNGVKLHYLTSPKTYEEYSKSRTRGFKVLQNYFANNLKQMVNDVKKSYNNAREEYVNNGYKVVPLGKKEFERHFKLGR